MSCCPCRRILADLQFLQQEADGDEVAVDQPFADLPHLGRDLGIQRADKVLHGHGREEPVAAIDGGLAAARIDGFDRHDALAVEVDLADPLVMDDPAAAAHDFPGDGLPHLPRTVLGIEELLDERSLGALLGDVAAAAKELAEDVLQGAEDRQALDPLRSPFGADGRTALAPDLLRIRLEERAIQLAAEAVDEELFQVLLRPEGKEAARR